MKQYLNFASTTFVIDTPFEFTVFSELFPQFVSSGGECDVSYTVHVGDTMTDEGLGEPIADDRSIVIYNVNGCNVRKFIIDVEHTRESAVYLVQKRESKPEYDMYIKPEDVSVLKRSFRILNAMAIEEALLLNGKLTLHGVILQSGNDGFVFTAPSGTGKSTITNRWAEMFSDSFVINGDCTVIGKENGVYYAYGSPFCGSSLIRENKKAPLRAIIRLYRGQENETAVMSSKESFVALYEASTVNHWSDGCVTACVELIQDVISSTPVIAYKCVNSPTAAEHLHTHFYP